MVTKWLYGIYGSTILVHISLFTFVEQWLKVLHLPPFGILILTVVICYNDWCVWENFNFLSNAFK